MQTQIDGMNAILDEWDGRQSTGKMIDNRHLTSMLATVFHETGATMQPVTENVSYSAERITEVWPTPLPGDRQRQAFRPKPAQACEQGPWQLAWQHGSR